MHKDGHLRVEAAPTRSSAGASAPAPSEADFQAAARRENFGFRKVEILDGNVGYLDLRGFTPLPAPPPGPAKAPEVVYPERGQQLERLLADLRTTRERSRQAVERVATVDPRVFTWRHLTLGELDLAQWWLLHVRHEADHLQQVRAVKAAKGFPSS